MKPFSLDFEHDELITRAARSMTDVDVPAAFGAGVMSRLGRQSTPSRWPRVAMGLAAAASLLLAVWMPRSAVVPAPLAPGSTQVTSAPPVVPGLVSDAPTVSAPRLARAHTPMSADELAWLARSVPSLAAPAPLALDSIQPPAPSIAPIVVEPLDATPIEVAAIDARAGGRQ